MRDEGEAEYGGAPIAVDGEGPGDLVKPAERTVLITEALAALAERLTLGQLQDLTGYLRSNLHALHHAAADGSP
ncbi:hypothetical protein H1V43_33155 [Streptomyces sp. PSKA54]|uniref:Uncharacterized protein n=1 Tax=Streptomyces himalayensis subsp. aureolus TaxID=2758039 RepID=A0A7W2D7A6_9ACTN|nr:hypothetical protein [Streptomyces himalayensis]MBA4866090.1 hypothetical protein [Streptomyces himalayensis subsp. aureolus]